jgi:hypothetical protein
MALTAFGICFRAAGRVEQKSETFPGSQSLLKERFRSRPGTEGSEVSRLDALNALCAIPRGRAGFSHGCELLDRKGM